MKKVLGIVGAMLLSGSAMAADLGAPPVYTKAPVIAPVFSWTGWYIGGNIGGGWGSNTNSNVSINGYSLNAAGFDTSFLNSRPNGIIGGGQIGYDWQFSPSWVVGLVADFQGANINGSSGASTTALLGINGLDASASASENLRFLGTVRTRLGWTTGNWMIYGSGGLAYGSVNSSENANLAFGNLGLADLSASSTETRVGWAAGAGINYALTQNWILGVDWLHYDLGHTSVTGNLDNILNLPASVTVDQKVGGDIVRGAINYKF